MTMLENQFVIGAAVVASLGGASDLRTAQIPNWLTYSSIVLALLLRSGSLGWSGFQSGLLGMVAAGGLFFLLFVIGAMGGGDVKLMASVCAWAGKDQVSSILIAAALAGGVMAVFYALSAQGISRTFWNIVDLISFRFTSGLRTHPQLNVTDGKSVRVPFGVAIAMGTLFCAGNVYWWR